MIPSLHTYNRILIAPLHWGLGHATRCIPIIDYLLSLGKEIAIAGDSSSFAMLQRRYPNLPSFELPAYNVRYGNSMSLSMLLQGPKLMITYSKEIKATKSIVEEWKPEVIISDNRFGLRSEKTHNIYLTHQLNIQHKNPNIARFANFIHQKFIHYFDECWVPDNEKHTLSGRLSDSQSIKIPCTYIGKLTRLKLSLTAPTFDVLTILSGPEPSRTLFENSIVNHPSLEGKRVHLVRGVNSKGLDSYPKNFTVHNILDQKELVGLINTSAVIICRSGYSTIMDLQEYDRPKYFLPTQGQTEQEYLAKYHNGKNNVTVIKKNGNILQKLNLDRLA